MAVRDSPTVGLLTAFEREGCRVVAVADDTTKARMAVEAHMAGLLIVDYDLPTNALRLTDDMARRGAGVVVRGPTADELEVFSALAAGALGFIDQSTSIRALARVAMVVADGGVAVPRTAEPLLVSQVRSLGGAIELKVGGVPMRLTRREWEVLLLLRQGRSTADIANRLFVSKPTVRTHVAALMHKMQAQDRAELASLLGPQAVAIV